MYTYELPYDVNKELCRILDSDDDWKELADHMKYSVFDINEIEQVAVRRCISPTYELFIRWGQQSHALEELFIALYRMKHVPALRCINHLVKEDFQKLMTKVDGSIRERKKVTVVDDNVRRQKTQQPNAYNRDLPQPVMRIEQAVQAPNSESLKNTPSTAAVRGNSGSTGESEIIRSVSAIPMLSYDELKEATGGWDTNNLLGSGGFGDVFKGEWKQLPVAIKRLKSDKNIKNKELIGELCLNQYRHDNILPLYGYSYGGAETCLVYQLLSGGSLEKRLKCKPPLEPLSWFQRYKIAHGVARGLLFLHTMAGEPLIHGDIKPANILLDHCTVPKIGDFGLSMKGHGKDRTRLKVSNIHGTEAYLPRQYLQRHELSEAVDVFSFGVVMAELATALPARRHIDNGYEYLYDRIHVAARMGEDFGQHEDKFLRFSSDSNPDLCRKFVAIALACTNYESRDHPTMLQVYKQIEGLDVPGKDLP